MQERAATAVERDRDQPWDQPDKEGVNEVLHDSASRHSGRSHVNHARPTWLNDPVTARFAARPLPCGGAVGHATVLLLTRHRSLLRHSGMGAMRGTAPLLGRIPLWRAAHVSGPPIRAPDGNSGGSAHRGAARRITLGYPEARTTR